MAQNLDELFQSAADQYGLPVGFLKSIAKQESGINVNVRDSDQGAQGIMQMLPQTAAAMGARDPRDPAQAIPAAARYLAEGLAKTGSLGGAAAYYHGGPDQRQWGPKTSAYVQSVGNLYNKSAQGSTPSQPPRLVNVADALGYMGESAKPTAQDIWGGGSSSSPAPATPSTRVTAKDIWGAPETGTDLSTPEARAAYLKEKGLSAGQPASTAKAFASGVATGVPILGPAAGTVANMAMGLQPGQAQADAPGAFTAGNLVGATAPYVAAGNFPMAARALGMAPAATGGSMLGQMAKGGVTNGLIGGMDAAARGDNPGEGAAFGAAGGAFGPVAGGVIGGTVNKLMQGVQGLMRPGIPGVGKGAANLLSQVINADDPAAVRAFLAQHGDMAMLADSGNALKTIASATAAKPTDAGSLISRNVEARAAGANDRISNQLTASLGPDVDPQLASAALKAQRSAVNAQYSDIHANAPPVDAGGVVDAIDSRLQNATGSQRTALQSLRQELVKAPAQTDEAGNVIKPEALHDSSERLHNLRKDVDALLSGKSPGLGVERGAVSSKNGALSEVRNALDDTLKTQVPGMAETDAKSAALASQMQGIQRGYENVLGGAGPHPDSYAAARAAQPPEVNAAENIGIRGRASRMFGTGTQRDAVTLNKLLAGGEDGYAVSNLKTAFGDQPTNALVDTLARERAFADTANAVNQGSKTGRVTFGNKLMDDSQPGSMTFTGATIPGLIAQGGKAAIIDPLIKMIMESPNAPRNLQVAQMLTAQGASRDEILQKLLDYNSRTGKVGAVGNALTNFMGGGANRLMLGASSTLRP